MYNTYVSFAVDSCCGLRRIFNEAHPTRFDEVGASNAEDLARNIDTVCRSNEYTSRLVVAVVVRDDGQPTEILWEKALQQAGFTPIHSWINGAHNSHLVMYVRYNIPEMGAEKEAVYMPSLAQDSSVIPDLAKTG